MKRFLRAGVWACLLVPSLLSSAARAEGPLDDRITDAISAAQAGGFLAPAELQPMPAAAEPAVAAYERGRDEIRAFEDGDWTFESEARSAMEQTKTGLTNAGFSVVSAQVYKRSEFPWPYFYKVEFISPNGYHYQFKTHQQGEWTFESEARSAMEQAVAGFKNSGYSVISGQVFKRSDYPWHYYYKIVYVVLRDDYPHPQPPQDEMQVLNGGPYKHEDQARSAMRERKAGLERAGYVVISAEIVRLPWPKAYFFRIEYTKRQGHDGPRYPRPRGR
ncbi:MAG: hypothetical protein HY924_05910 [Elusimicrobia bacterium]|nr:hypothetical protein [Elusimicrobiota bacterium]